MSPKKALLALLLASWCLAPLAYRLSQPFLTRADKDGAAFAQAGRNYLRYGLAETRLGMSLNAGDPTPDTFVFNDRHPPGVAMGAAVAYALFGVSEWATRVYPATCTFGSLVVLYLLWNRHRGAGAAALVVAVMATLPAYGFYGMKLGEEAPTLFWGLLAILFYDRWKHAPRSPFTPCPVAFAIGCFSGWAGFYVAPLLMADALITLRDDPEKRRRALVGLALAVIVVSVLVIGQIALLSGSLDRLITAGKFRLISSPTVEKWDPGLGDWLTREGEYLLRLFGVPGIALAGLGMLSALQSGLRRLWNGHTAMMILVLCGFGVAHSVAFRWAAYFHDWLLFYLMPVVSIGVVEGILFARMLAVGLLGRLRVPTMVMRATSLLLIIGGMTYVAVNGARGLWHLSHETPRYVWVLLGEQLEKMAPDDSAILANFKVRSLPLVYYADREVIRATSLDHVREGRVESECSLYLQDRNQWIQPRLVSELSTHPSVDLAGFRIYDLRRAGDAATRSFSSNREGWIDAGFGDSIRLTGYAIRGPEDSPAPMTALDRFFGLRGGSLSHERIVAVRTYWSTTDTDLPPWRVMLSLVGRGGDGRERELPLIAMDEWRRPVLTTFRARERFEVLGTFMFDENAFEGEYELRIALEDGGRAVRPVLPGEDRPDLKRVTVGPIPIPGGDDRRNE